MEKVLLISIGAILGANLRYWLGDWVAQHVEASLPVGTVLINLTGSFILAVFMTLFLERFMIDPRWRILFAVGFLGSYTTFSTYTYESMTLVMNGQWLLGLLNLLGSAGLGGVASILGVAVGRLI